MSLTRRAAWLLKLAGSDPDGMRLHLLREQGLIGVEIPKVSRADQEEIQILKEFDLILPSPIADRKIYVVGFIRGRRKCFPLKEFQEDLEKIRNKPSTIRYRRIYDILQMNLLHLRILRFYLRIDHRDPAKDILRKIGKRSTLGRSLLKKSPIDFQKIEKRIVLLIKRTESEIKTLLENHLKDLESLKISQSILDSLLNTRGVKKKIVRPPSYYNYSYSSFLQDLRRILVKKRNATKTPLANSRKVSERPSEIKALQEIMDQLVFAIKIVYGQSLAANYDIRRIQVLRKFAKDLRRRIKEMEPMGASVLEYFKIMVARYRYEHVRGSTPPPRSFWARDIAFYWSEEYFRFILNRQAMRSDPDLPRLAAMVERESLKILRPINILTCHGPHLKEFNLWRWWMGHDAVRATMIEFEVATKMTITSQQFIRAQLLFLKERAKFLGKFEMSEVYAEPDCLHRAIRYVLDYDPTQHLDDSEWQMLKNILEEQRRGRVN